MLVFVGVVQFSDCQRVGGVFRWRFRVQGDAAAEVSAIVP